MNLFDLANLLDNDGNLQNEMMVMAFAAMLLSTIPVLLGNEFDVNVGLRKRRNTVDFFEEKYRHIHKAINGRKEKSQNYQVYH